MAAFRPVKIRMGSSDDSYGMQRQEFVHNASLRGKSMIPMKKRDRWKRAGYHGLVSSHSQQEDYLE